MKRYGMSICLLIKDENQYINEWLEWHIAQGVDHFYIYDNGSKVPIVRSIYEQYIDLCTIVDWSGYHGHTQIDAYEDCLLRFGYETEWLAFIDTDEFLRVVDTKSLTEFLSGNEFQQADVVVLGWITYNANGHIKRSNQPVRKRFTKTVEYPEHLPQCKCVVRPEHVTVMGPHYPIATHWPLTIVDEMGRVHESILHPLTRNRLVVDHYFTRSYEEWLEKMGRGSCDPNYSREFDWFWWMNPDMEVAKYDR